MSTLQSPETCEYVTLHDKTDSIDMSKFRILMWEGSSDYPAALRRKWRRVSIKKGNMVMKAERQVMTEAEAGRMHFEDGRRGHREGM